MGEGMGKGEWRMECIEEFGKREWGLKVRERNLGGEKGDIEEWKGRGNDRRWK
jgi:hypothetical protein